MTKPALKLEPEYRSPLEKETAAQLKAEGIKFDYEGMVLRFTIPAFEAKYKPDFPICDTNIIIETKGRFGHRGSGGAEVRQRLCLVKEAHPELDIRILFQTRRTAKLAIYKGSKTTQGQWATDHGFKWACGPTIPKAWIEEMKRAQHRPGTEAQPSGPKRPTTSRKKAH